MVELTEEELQNGWTKDSLEAYFKDREKAQAVVVLADRRQRPRFANNLYRPLRWR